MSPCTDPSANIVTGPGRPRVHASDAAKVAAYRSRNVRVEAVVSQDIGRTLGAIASDLDVSKNALIADLLRFALTNRDWRRLGLMGTNRGK